MYTYICLKFICGHSLDAFFLFDHRFLPLRLRLHCLILRINCLVVGASEPDKRQTCS